MLTINNTLIADAFNRIRYFLFLILGSIGTHTHSVQQRISLYVCVLMCEHVENITWPTKPLFRYARITIPSYPWKCVYFVIFWIKSFISPLYIYTPCHTNADYHYGLNDGNEILVLELRKTYNTECDVCMLGRPYMLCETIEMKINYL